MKLRPAADNLLERIALGANLVPMAAGYALHGMTSGRVLGAAQRLGIRRQGVAAPAVPRPVAARGELMRR